MTNQKPSVAQSNLSPAQKLAASRQILRDALHTASKKKAPAPKTQQVVRKKTAFAPPIMQVKKTRSHTHHAVARNAPTVTNTAGKSAPRGLRNIQQVRTVLGAWLLRRWSKQPARAVAAAVQPVLQRGIRKYPKHAVGLAAAAGALFVAWQVWRCKKTYSKKKTAVR